MHIVVNEELKAYIDPLSPEEHAALERSLLAEGCRDALVLWGDVLVDGHNRYGICQKHGLPFRTVQNQNFRSMEDVHLWMIDQHLGRRSVSDFQRGVLALRKREILADRNARISHPESDEGRPGAGESTPADAPGRQEPSPDAATPGPGIEPQPLANREAIAKAARLSSSQVVMIEKIRKQAAPEVVAAVKSGTLSINAAAAVSTLPQEEQRAAAIAGGNELKQAAKRVREAKRKPREETDGVPSETLQSLRDRVAELTAENEELRRQLAQRQAQPGE